MCLCELASDQTTMLLIIVALVLIWYFSSCGSSAGVPAYPMPERNDLVY